MPQTPPPINLAVLVSGSGTTLQNLIDEIAAGRLEAKISLVIASRPGILGTERATQAGIPNVVVNRRDFAEVADFSREVFRRVDAAGVDLICLAGWLCLLDLPERYAHRAMNIHPALLPSFGGKGLYGAKVHEAVINHGCKVSGCTVHFLDNSYDTGPIIVQRTCPVLDDDTPATLAQRVFEEEKIAYPEAIRLFQQGRLCVEGRRVRVMPAPRRTTS
ncbi:MAG TPA: phosphoribosylglycinamide formyltransferase [Tepidisphaeraceae bacterium]|nr:phosphoribosylglycinamide formyltransferase [Tepidisphaeraceae bacterium]